MIYLTSDTHFYHTNIIEYDQRPFKDVLEMNRVIVEKWNEIVAPWDIVYHLGDFGLASEDKLREILMNLNGQITLVRGNHDSSLTQLQEIGFVGICDEMMLKYYGYHFIMTHEPKNSYELLDGVVNIHGHTHSEERFSKKYINVCCKAWDYKPIPLEEIIKQYKQNKRGNK